MIETITIAGGCFWCTEAIFKQLKGVLSVVPGYSGGNKENPTYNEVCSGKTGHAESIEIKFESNLISLERILQVFFATHDPTTLNKQGNDEGSQYRSVIFYRNEYQKKTAEELIQKIQTEYADKIVTEIVEFKNFFEAEDYHKNYYEQNKNKPYCSFVISPKLNKLKEKYPDLIK